jgi:hypothetical protein
MPDITYRESEIVAKLEVTRAYPSNGMALVGRPIARMIDSGEYHAILLLIKRVA